MLAASMPVYAAKPLSAEGGSVEVYDFPVSVVYDSAVTALQMLGMNFDEADKAQNRIFASVSGGVKGEDINPLSYSYGTRIGVFFIGLPDDRTQVRVVSKEKNVLNTDVPGHTYKVHMAIHSQLIKYSEAEGHFEESFGKLKPVTAEALEAENAFWEKHKIRGVGFTSYAKAGLIKFSVKGRQTKFSYEGNPEVYWFLDQKPNAMGVTPLKVNKKAARPGLYIEWKKPDGQIFKAEPIKKYDGLMFSRLDLKTVPEAQAPGIWNAVVTLNDEPFFNGNFEVVKS